MEREKIIRGIEAFDPELFDFIQMELKTQRYTLSLLPNENYASPFCSYLKGSLLSNTYMDYHDVVTCSRLESLAIERAKRLFGSEAAIVRINNLVAASQIVFHNFVNTGDTIMSFNLRKQEYCYTKDMKYNFVKYSIEPETQHLDYRHIEALAQECRPKMIIFSPTNYPKDVNYRKLAQIAHGVGAVLWVDMSAVVGLVAAKLMHSPVPHADVVTFYTHDTLRGPQSAVILTNSENVDSLNQIAINTGHVYLQENVLAALCIAFREAETPEFGKYCQQCLKNANALMESLKDNGLNIVYHGTNSQYVAPEVHCEDRGPFLSQVKQAGFIVKCDNIMTFDDDKTIPALRLSSLIPTTRGIKEEEMVEVGRLLSKAIVPDLDSKQIAKIRQSLAEIVFTKPLFSEEWLPRKNIINPLYSSQNINYSRELYAANKKSFLKHLFGFDED